MCMYGKSTQTATIYKNFSLTGTGNDSYTRQIFPNDILSFNELYIEREVKFKSEIVRYVNRVP